jgi:hypothetical protein
MLKGIYTVEAKLEVMCPGYARMDVLFGSRHNVQPPVLIDSNFENPPQPVFTDPFLDAETASSLLSGDLFTLNPEIESSLHELVELHEDSESTKKKISKPSKTPPSRKDFSTTFAECSEANLQLGQSRLELEKENQVFEKKS